MRKKFHGKTAPCPTEELTVRCITPLVVWGKGKIKEGENVDSTLNDIRILKEVKRLKRVFKNVADNVKNLTDKLINRAAFMLVSLEDMESEITKSGLMLEMSQGEYSIDRAHPLISSYNTMIKNYSAVIKQLTELLPHEDKLIAGNELMKYLTQPRQTVK